MQQASIGVCAAHTLCGSLKNPDMPAAGVMEHVKNRGAVVTCGAGVCVYHVTRLVNGRKKKKEKTQTFRSQS